MSFKGLNDFRQKQEAKKVQQDDTFFKLKEKNQRAFIRPLVELDETSINYSEKNGVPLFTQEFTNPQKFWLSVLDTTDDEGASFGRDMIDKYGWYVQKDPKADKNQHSDKNFNWNPQQYVYLPVLVKDNKDDEPRVETMRVKYRGAEVTALIDFANADRTFDEDGNSSDPYGSITDRWWAYSRNGEEGLAVRYTLTAKDPSTDVNVEDYEVPDLTQFVNAVPYAEQEAFLQVATNRIKDLNGVPTEDLSSGPGQVASPVSTAKW